MIALWLYVPPWKIVVLSMTTQQQRQKATTSRYSNATTKYIHILGSGIKTQENRQDTKKKHPVEYLMKHYKINVKIYDLKSYVITISYVICIVSFETH